MANRFCVEAKRENFGDCTTIFEGGPDKDNNDCPAGWRFIESTQGNCGRLGKIVGLQSVCEKTEWSKPRWRCCLESNGSDEECEPGYCQATLDSDACQREMDKRCLSNVTQMLNPECRQYVLRDANLSRKPVIEAVQRYCKSGDVGFDDVLCRCVNADDPDLCYDDDCWARRNFNMRQLRYCAAEECKVPRQGVFQPTGSFAECADICAPALKLEDVDIRASEATTLLNACSGDWSNSEREQFLRNAAGSVSEVTGDTPALRQQQLIELLGLDADGKPAHNGSNNDKKGGDSDQQQNDGGLPTWAWILIGIGSFLLLLLIGFIVYFLTRPAGRRAQWTQRFVPARLLQRSELM